MRAWRPSPRAGARAGGEALVAAMGDLALDEKTEPIGVGQGADLDRARCRCLDTLGAERAHQAHDAEAGAETLFGMRAALQDQLA